MSAEPESSIGFGILEILINCEFPPSSYRNFAGIRREDLRRLSLDDLESRLRNCLPPSPARASLVSRFISALFNREEGHSSSQNDPGVTPVIIKQEVIIKVEAADSSTPATPPPPPTNDTESVQGHSVPQENRQEQNKDVNGPGQDDSNPAESNGVGSVPQPDDPGSDSDVEFVEEVMNVSIIHVVDPGTKVKEEIVQVTLQDEDDNEQFQEALPIVGGAIALPSTSSTSADARLNKRKSEPPRLFPAPEKGYSTKPKLAKRTFFKLGRTFRKRPEWSKTDFKSLTSSTKSPYVEQLSILANANYSKYSPLPTPHAKFTLPKLAILKISHRVKEIDDLNLSSVDINYSTQLGEILVGSPSLARIEICYEDEMALRSLLRVLGSVPGLPSLSSLFIRHRDENDLVALLASDIIVLSEIKAPNLKNLHLSSCIWADDDGTVIKEAVEGLIGKFPNLVKLKIEGCFVTSTKPCPKIVLDFPKLRKLQVLDLGASCKYSSEFETVEKRPKKKKRRKLAIRSDPGQMDIPTPAPEEATDLPDDLIEDERGEYIPIKINLGGFMPALKSVSLGVLYEFQTFYFSDFSNALKIFRVASQWAESYPVYFPVHSTRKGEEVKLQTSKVEELQFPDYFQDCFIITKIMPHFPNLSHIHINMPTVKFIRAFAKTMKIGGPDSFQHLTIKIQFDFASSLDSCILEKIQSPSLLETEKLKILKAYPHWEDYVLENQIELPLEIIEKEDGNKFCGLGVLFKKLKTLTIRHIPRTLRIPKGPRHWIDDPNPEFTDTLIGFKEYPFHRAVKNKCPSILKVTCYDFDMTQVADDFKEGPYYENGQVQLDPGAPSIKKEVKLEKNKESASTSSASVINV